MEKGASQTGSDMYHLRVAQIRSPPLGEFRTPAFISHEDTDAQRKALAGFWPEKNAIGNVLEASTKVDARHKGAQAGRFPTGARGDGRGRPPCGLTEERAVLDVLMGEGSGVMPGPGAARRAEEALAWVLWAVFAYAEAISLKPPPFW